MSLRFQSVEQASNRSATTVSLTDNVSSDIFGQHVFNRAVMQRMLPREIYRNVVRAQEGEEKIKPEYADSIAVAMKEWAISLGATHYTHWFQPLTGKSAEKHDSFIEWAGPGEIIEKFNGKQLIQGEPDASSFPSGGLRNTYEARGYTGWDPSSPAFVWKGGDGVTLCIPSIFFSWTGAVLDNKIPLLRSDCKISQALTRLLSLTGIAAKYVYSTLGCEQEYFVIDRALRNQRYDLLLTGRTVVGAPSPKGQELQDHYFGSVKDRVLAYMRDFETIALQLGIPVKTRHNEVAPAQHEVAPVYEKASTAVDHNIMIMEIMRQVAVKHNLACLLHEKPFQGLNGSGKHCNWSLSTDEGINLLDPTEAPENNLHFLILITAILDAIYRHSALLRASIGSASNDFRLGGHEAPPAIMSVYLGEELEMILDNIEKLGSHERKDKLKEYQLGLKVLPDLKRDDTDRNRTSPFAFTGNKFEFRAVGSSSSPSFPVTVLNAIVAESLNLLLDEVELKQKKKNKNTPLIEIVIPILQSSLKKSRAVRFHGDNYSEAWQKEAKRRGLPNIQKSPYAFESLVAPSTIKAFKEILTSSELQSRYEIYCEQYAMTLSIEAKTLLDIFQTNVLHAALKTQKEIAKTLIVVREAQKNVSIKQTEKLLTLLTAKIESSIALSAELERKLKKAKNAYDFADDILPQTEALREVVDQLETLIEDDVWPLPKYREILFLV